MAVKLPVWGIDVGQSSLKAIKLQQTGDQVEMLAFDLVEHEGILAQAGPEAPEMFKKALQAFLSRNDLRNSLVVVSVPGQQTLTRFTKMPPVEPKKIPDMVQYEASQQIPFDMDEVVWDYQVFTEKDSPDVEVGIFAIRKELIRNYLLQFTESGVSPVIVQSSPMASYNAARFEQPAELGRASILLDMGALATDLIVMEGNRIWSRPIPIGGNRFTESLVSAFKISFGKAERLKRAAAASKHARQIFQAMRPVLQDLVNEIQRSIGYYTSTHREAHITRVIGMGNAFKLPGLQKFLTQNLQMEVEKLASFKHLAVGGEQSPTFTDNIMSFPVAYGLALQGLGLAAVESNLLPHEIRRALLWRKKQPWFIGAAAALALGAAALWVGNVMAEGQIASAAGGLTKLQPQDVRFVEEAERIINGGAGGTPLERAAKVAGAAERLKQEFAKISGTSPGDVHSLGTMAGLLENNIWLPRIMATIHQAFEEVTPEDLKRGNVRDYVSAAKRTKRGDRQETWIRKLEMAYDANNPVSMMPPASVEGDKKPKGSGPGWVIRVVGETPLRGDAPMWLDDKLIKALDALGKTPGRGFYFERVYLEKVAPVSLGELSLPELGTMKESAASGGGGRGSRLSGGEGGGRGKARAGAAAGESSRGRRGRVNVESLGAGGGRSASRGFAESATPSGFGSSGSFREQAEKFKKAFQECDPLLPDEKTSEDQQYVIYILVRKENTPKNLLPEEYQQGDKGEKKEAPPEERREDQGQSASDARREG